MTLRLVFWFLFALLPLPISLFLKAEPEKRRGTERIAVSVLFTLEAVKQILGIFDGWRGHLPFHYSASFYLSLGLYAFGDERARHFGGCVSFVGGVFLTLCMLISPVSIVGGEPLFSSFFSFYGYFFHFAVVLLVACMAAGGEYRPEKYDPLRYALFLALWGCVAVPAAYRTGYNFIGILHSYLPPLEAVRLRFGDGVYLFVYYLSAVLLAAGILRLFGMGSAEGQLKREKATGKPF